MSDMNMDPLRKKVALAIAKTEKREFTMLSDYMKADAAIEALNIVGSINTISKMTIALAQIATMEKNQEAKKLAKLTLDAIIKQGDNDNGTVQL